MPPRRPAAAPLVALLPLLALAAPGCGDEVILVNRSGCLACHRPLQPDGTPHGIEKAHPDVNGRPLTCVACHGGNASARKQSEAHVSPGRGGDPFIKNLTIGELDEVDAKFLRFVNPSDYRVARLTCGKSGCHPDITRKVVTNQMATFSGELGVARYRAGMQPTGAGVKAVYDVRDPTYVRGKIPGTVGSLSKMTEPRVRAGETRIGPYQDLYLTKACLRCHTWSFGDNKLTGDFRSSGCAACHVVYADDGISRSADPRADKEAPPHPEKHVITRAPPTRQCVHCHYRGARIGISYQGYREGAGVGFNPPRPAFLGKALHGHDASYYITDENRDNSYDETPPDVHFQAGMHCVDCHTSHDVHGDGHIYTTTSVAVEIRCQDCHGTATKEATFVTRLGNRLKHLSRDAKGDVWLTTKVTGKRLKVTQIKRSIQAAPKGSLLAQLMGRDAKGFSHMDKMACHTCHTAWMPNCYGCHVTADMQNVQRSLISGISTPGWITGGRRWVAVDDLILMLDNQGRVAPSMPSERMFFTAIDGAGNRVIHKRVRTGPNGEPGMGQRAINPHTIQRWSPFMSCDRCHTAKGVPAAKQKARVAVGFGSDRYVEKDGSGKAWRLDQVQTTDFKPVVLVGNDEPKVSRPLPRAMVERMLKVVVTPPPCPGPGGAAVPFGIIQDSVLTPRCATSGCHGPAARAGGLDLSPGKARAALVGRPSTAMKGATLVVPGYPARSYLLQKLVANGKRVGTRMPPKGAALKDCEVGMIRGWIAAGAR